MESYSGTLPMHFVLNLFQGVRLDVARRKKLLLQAGIPFFVLEEPAGRVTIEQFARFYRLLVNELDDETPGFFSSPLKGGTLKFLCLALMDAPNLHIALKRYCQFFHLLCDDLAYQLEVDSRQATLRFTENKQLQGHRVLVHELMLKLVHGIASWLIAEKILPMSIDCAYQQPQHSSEYLYFYPGSVCFNQPWTAFSFDRSLLSRPLRRTRTDLGPFLKRAPADWIYVSFSDSLLAHRVRDYLSVPGNEACSLAEVADALHRSVRTLSRRLALEGTKFQTVKDEVRRDLAVKKLTSEEIPLIALAQLLGFEDLPSFNRAFKNWTGSTPGTYRRSRANKNSSLRR